MSEISTRKRFNVLFYYIVRDRQGRRAEHFRVLDVIAQDLPSAEHIARTYVADNPIRFMQAEGFKVTENPQQCLVEGPLCNYELINP